MRHIPLVSLIVFIIFLSACGEDLLPTSSGNVDTMITEEDALAQNYNHRTPGYDIQVAIRDDVDGDINNILELLDVRAEVFLDCQFMMGSEIGSDDFKIPSGNTVFPLSMLMVFVVPFNFECDAVDKSICAGIYYFGSDLIIIAEEGLGRCGKLPLWEHELGHRYGMAADHNNQDEFEPCIDPPDCDIIDFPEIFARE